MKQVQMTTFDPTNVKLFVEIEDKMTGDLWRGDFQSKYIEEITQKTGSYKKFNIFVKMLLSALKGETQQVYIDILTFSDLEMLKKKNSGPSASTTSAAASNNKKRYFILTYVAEFERVHYPLPLNYVDEPEPDSLRRTIERMKNQIQMQKSNAFSTKSENKIEDFALIEVENEQLRR